MARVIKGNCERVVPDDLVASYIKDGYSQIDDKGNVITPSEPQSLSQIKAERDEYRRLAQRRAEVIERMRAGQGEIEELKAKLKEASDYAEAADAKIDALEAKLASKTKPSAIMVVHLAKGMAKADMMTEAERLGVEIPDGSTNAEIYDLIEAHIAKLESAAE